MAGLSLFLSNRLEALAEKLVVSLRNFPLPPLQQEIIIVQSRGMERWLAMETATIQGVWANFTCSFPNSFIWEIFRRIIDNLPEKNIYEKDYLTWRLMDILPELEDCSRYGPIKSYLKEGREIKYYQLAAEVGDLFDQYTLYRNDLIENWETSCCSENHQLYSRDEAWQSGLWCQLAKRAGNKKKFHRTALLKTFLARLNDPSFDPEILPPRVSIFGISSLPPFHIQVMAALSQHIDVNMFIMNPCQEYWADIVSQKDIGKISNKTGNSPENMYLDIGNSLLSSMGNLGRDFLAEIQNYSVKEHDCFQIPGGSNLLCNIQKDILTLHNRGILKDNTDRVKDLISKNDHSIQFHSCFSPLREVEALFDHIINLFNQNDNKEIPKPHEILVMTPDIDTYGPLIQAVFDSSSADNPKIPFNIADRNFQNESSLAKTFIKILYLPDSRFTLSEVFDVLESDDVKRRFSFDGEDLELIHHWCHSTRIRWGINGEFRKMFGNPPFEENTWRAGIDRLLLGFALAGKGDKLFSDILPYAEMEGSATEVLGRFSEFIDILFSLINKAGSMPGTLTGKHTLANWSDILFNVLDNFFVSSEETEYEMQTIRSEVNSLKDLHEHSGFEKEIELEVIRLHLCRVLQQEKSSSGFLTGGVTFCKMLPMRAIPFKYIHLIGLNGSSFPRQNRSHAFNLIAKNPRRGDRSVRKDDRYLFLESLLSARNMLYISYVGQSIRDNYEIQPSVLVSELMEYIDNGFRIPGYKSILEVLHTRHRLQAFNPLYFQQNSDKYYSYDVNNFQAAKAFTESQRNQASFVSGRLEGLPLPEPDDDFQQLDIEELCDFFIHPARFFLNNRLGIFLSKRQNQAEDHEPFTIEGLDRFLLETCLLERELSGSDLSDYRVIKKAEGILPHGVIGELEYNEIISDISRFKQSITPYISADPLPPLEIDLTINRFRLTGRIEGLRKNGLLRFRSAKIKAKDRLKCWIEHQAVNAAGCEECESYESTLIGKDRSFRYQPDNRAFEILEKLLNIYWQGLSQPLPFFPDSSFVFAENHFMNKTKIKDMMKKARNKWEGNEYYRGEGDDPYFRMCFRNMDPFNGEMAERFADLSTEVISTLLECQEVLS